VGHGMLIIGINVVLVMEKKSKKHCVWCGKPTIMEPMKVADIPILEFMEEKINAYGRERIWGKYGDWSMEDLDSDFEAELLVYDEMLCSISKKIVCINCLKTDDELWKRYYSDSDEDMNIEFIPE